MKSYALATLVILWFLFIGTACGGSDRTIIPSFSDIHVTISEDGRLLMNGKTSLPDGTKLASMIMRLPDRKGVFMDAPLDYPESMDVVVSAGTFQSWFPTAYEKGVKEGKYILQIGVLPDQKDILGPKNSWLKGSEVVTETNGHHTYAPESELALPDIPAHTDQ